MKVILSTTQRQVPFPVMFTAPVVRVTQSSVGTHSDAFPVMEVYSPTWVRDWVNSSVVNDRFP